MESPQHHIGIAVGELALLSVLALFAPMGVTLDLVVFQNGVTEISFTELMQTTCLLLSVVSFAGAARRCPESRGFFVLGSGFFTTMLIREQDRWLGSAWLWLALAVTAGCVVYAFLRGRSSVWGPLSDFIDTKPYYLMAFGLLVVVVFSRLFGSGSLIWKPAMGVQYSYLYKSVLQEGLELFGYTYIASGAWVVALRVDQGRALAGWRR